jgi:subtilisin family serine protease
LPTIHNGREITIVNSENRSMRQNMRRIIILALLIGLLVISSAWAGRLSTQIVQKITVTSPDDRIPIIISLEQPSLPSALKMEIQKHGGTAAEHHRYGIDHLKNRAAMSQAEVIGLLKQMENSGLAANIKSHWIINVISAEVTASEIEEIARRSDVAEIFLLPEISTLETESYSVDPLTPSQAGVESNIVAVKADAAWARGYTGKGRIVCSFDTGVQGNHPALAANWKGLDGNWAAAWFDPIGGQSFPHALPVANSGHGTHTMGIMVGHDDVLGDTIGVAPEAKWISAGVINVLGASIIDAFEWAADPDGDLNTIDDVPDVINHSWGLPNSTYGCDEYFWRMIDNTEALGIVNIFSAGNFGPGDMTIANPANRALDSLDCFAVGNINDSNNLIYSNSSRGPSDCDGVSIKPNLVAPGVNILSSIPPSTYGLMGGTSMAAPHVAGAVAILRQKAPSATVDEIKEAILKGCRRINGTYPDNTYGWGMLDIAAALDSLVVPGNPELRVYSFDYPPLNPGDTARGYVTLVNLGGALNGVSAEVSGSHAAVTVLTSSLYFGHIGMGDTARSDIRFAAVVSDTVTPGSMLYVNFDLFGNPAYSRPIKLHLQVGQVPRAGYYTHKNDLLRFTISNLGQYGFASGSFFPLGYSGFRYIDTLRNDLFEGALMFATDSAHVSDGARNIVEEPDNDFAVSPGGDLVALVPGGRASQETFAVLDDSKAESPIGLEIEQKTYSWDDAVNNNYVILEYSFKNVSGDAISGLYAGLFFDWDLPEDIYQNWGGYSDPDNLGYMYYTGTVDTRFRGLSVINSEEVASYRLRRNPTSAPYLYFAEAEKYDLLSSGIKDTAAYGDYAQIISTGPFSLAPGQSDTAVFAVMGADSLVQIKATAQQALTRYQIATDVAETEPDNLPGEFFLGQNFPNPFNPSTLISFGLSTKDKVKLSIYNILGERVIDLVDRILPAGRYEPVWDGRDRSGKALGSGIYFYRLSAGERSLARKMVMLK